MRKDPGIDGFPIHLSTIRATPNREPGRGRGMTFAFVDVGAVCPIADVARVAHTALLLRTEDLPAEERPLCKA